MGKCIVSNTVTNAINVCGKLSKSLQDKELRGGGGGNVPHNSRLQRQFYERGNCVVSYNAHHQKKVYPPIGETSTFLQEFFQKFLCSQHASHNLPGSAGKAPAR